MKPKIEPKIKKPRKYNWSSKAQTQRENAAKSDAKKGRTAYQSINVPKAMLGDFESLREGNESQWMVAVRGMQALKALKSIREKLLKQGDTEIRDLAKYLDEYRD